MTGTARRRHVVVMVATSYPRFPGDLVGTFMEPIARGVAARGHAVHLVVPWHPRWSRVDEPGLSYHPFKYAPHSSLNVFGYAQGLEADVRLKTSAWLAAPLGVLSGCLRAASVARSVGATVLHGHWVVPGGVMAALAGRGRPLVVSLHGSDVYVAERHAVARAAARHAFARAAWVTACSEDLARRAVGLGAREDGLEVLPYGVDVDRFRPEPEGREPRRREIGLTPGSIGVLAVGRFVRKKGFEYLIDAAGRLRDRDPAVHLLLAGGGDLENELRARAAGAGVAERVHFLGLLTQDEVARTLAAADIAVVPSVRDDQGNVDGLPNTVLEALASGVPLVATPAGGIGAVVRDGLTAIVVPERDAEALAAAILSLAGDPALRRRLGDAGRHDAATRHAWSAVAERLERAYDRASLAASARP